MDYFKELKRRIESAKQKRFNDFVLGLFVETVIRDCADKKITREQKNELWTVLGYKETEHYDDMDAFVALEPQED